MSKETLKILVAGSVQGNFKQLCSRVNNVNSKSGPFHLLLIPGHVIGDNAESWLSLRDGSYKLDVPTYILGATKESHTAYFSHIVDGEVTENVTYLGRRGVYTTTNGLSIAYISGVFGDGMSNEPHCYTETDLNILQAQSGVMNGIDILITSQWPSDVLRYVKKPDFKVPEGIPELSHLVNTIKPRYHFVSGPYYERLPYRNHKILHEKATYCTRFLSLDCAGNKTKSKWLYALNYVPMKHLTDAELRKQPAETTENPYIEVEKEQNKVEDLKQQHFYSVGDKRKMTAAPGGADGKEKKKESCWFCLKSPNVEKHLVISVGASMYLALAKGALSNDHVMIVPTNHIKCQQFLEPNQQEDVEKFKRAIRTLNRTNKKSTTVFFERSLSTSHMQIQAVPVARYSVNDIKDVFYTFADKYNLEVQEIPVGEDWKEMVPPGSDYFIAEFENQDKLVFLCSQKVRFPLQFGREVLASEELLNMPRRVSWKECKISKEQEEHDVKMYRKSFTEFDPFKVDDSDSDSD